MWSVFVRYTVYNIYTMYKKWKKWRKKRRDMDWNREAAGWLRGVKIARSKEGESNQGWEECSIREGQLIIHLICGEQHLRQLSSPLNGDRLVRRRGEVLEQWSLAHHHYCMLISSATALPFHTAESSGGMTKVISFVGPQSFSTRWERERETHWCIYAGAMSVPAIEPIGSPARHRMISVLGLY